ncbi:MAG TPA: recombination mediator RecR [Nitrospiria bacterium]|nr:recombination mediator RecR [Nitrospiria bacterium]
MSNKVFDRLIEQLKKLPGIGQKTAQRLAFFLLKMPVQEAKDIAQAILDVKDRLRLCNLCQNASEEDVCAICRDPKRDQTRVLVVKEPSTLYAIDRTGEYRGLYHVLVGTLSPLNGPSPGQMGMIPADIKTKELLDRLQGEGTSKVQEVILATDPTMEGEATALYLAKLIKPLGIKVTRIACGIPAGADIEYADEVTLIKSLEGRREF